MADVNAAISGLSQQSEKHEKEIVTELGVDRFQTYIGVYALFTLSLVSKIANVIPGTNLSCFPISVNESSDKSYLDYASGYCWMNGQVSVLAADDTPFSEIEFNRLKFVADWLTLFLFLQALSLAIPGFLWHHVVTGRLLGHLKFVNILLSDIYEKVKTLKMGAYRGRPYDQDGVLLNSNAKIDSEPTPSNQENANSKIVKENELKEIAIQKESTTKICIENESAKPEEKKGLIKKSVANPKTKKQRKKKTFWLNLEYLLYGNTIVDQHIFSLFCEENFAHLEYYAYIISICKLTGRKKRDDDKPSMYPIHQAILKLWMHKNNLTSRILTKRYLRKHMLSALASLCFLIAYFIFFGFLVGTLSMSTIGCKVPDYPALRCTYPHKNDVWFLYILNLVVLLVYFTMSTWKIVSVRKCHTKPSSDFFKVFRENGNVALLAVYKQEEDANKKNE